MKTLTVSSMKSFACSAHILGKTNLGQFPAMIRTLSTHQGSTVSPTSNGHSSVCPNGQRKGSLSSFSHPPALLTGTTCLANIQVRHLADSKQIREKVEKYRQGSFDDIPDPSELPHFKTKLPSKASGEATIVGEDGQMVKAGEETGIKRYEYTLPHPIWTDDQIHSVKVTHKEPEGFVDKMAYGTVKLFRGGFDILSGFKFGDRNERKWLNRIVFLETVAGVPGMVAAMMRHMRSLRRLQRDQGWIHTLLEEAENERMHLLTALQLKQPSVFFRMAVIGAQGVFVTMFGLSYAVSPKFCHRFVGYLEEEAVKTYTKCLQDINEGPMIHWQTQPAPPVAVRYWKLESDATMKDVILAIRADEAHHRVVNHSLASLKKDEFNPYKPGE